MQRGIFMKVIVLSPPKFLSPIFRFFLGRKRKKRGAR